MLVFLLWCPRGRNIVHRTTKDDAETLNMKTKCSTSKNMKLTLKDKLKLQFVVIFQYCAMTITLLWLLSCLNSKTKFNWSLNLAKAIIHLWNRDKPENHARMICAWWDRKTIFCPHWRSRFHVLIDSNDLVRHNKKSSNTTLQQPLIGPESIH